MIEIKNLNRIFKNGFGLMGVNFVIPKGSIVAFVGDNGAGKTTTIKAIFNELKLSSGEVLIEGENLFANKNLQKIAFFPDSNSIPLNMKLDDYILYICSVNGIDRAESKHKMDNVYNMLGLQEHRKKKIKELSAGWKKRAIMASVLVRSPEYIILDEPTANLDVKSKLEFIELLKDLNKYGVTIMITSHIIEELQEIATRLVLINKGEITYDNEFDKNNQQIIELYKSKTTNENNKFQGLGGLYAKNKN